MILLARKEARERDIADYLTKCDKEGKPAGMFVSVEERAYQVRVLKAFWELEFLY